VNSAALQAFAERHLADEFRDVHPICFWAHDRGLIHANRKVARLEDLAGLRVRYPTRLAGEALKALGAVPVGMPVPQVPEALAQRVIDGCVVPWEIVPSIKVQELVKHHTDFPGTPTLYTASFVLAMNKARYAALPADLRAVIDANSGQAAAAMVAAMFDGVAPKVEATATARGNTVTTLSTEENARWAAACRPVIDGWLAASKGAGFDGEALLADLTGELARRSAA
jgi:TRAP-type C4-dicarboxylate transport system substrate-binding protein